MISLLFLLIKPFSVTLEAQDEVMVDVYSFLFGQVNVPSQVVITHTLTALGSYWEFETDEWPLSENTEWEIAAVSITGSTSSIPSTSGSTAWKGFVFPWRHGGHYEYTDSIAYGIYKVTNSYNNYYFYLDLRDCRYDAPRELIYDTYGPDFAIRFGYSSGTFKYGQDFANTIPTGGVFNVWDYFSTGTPNTSYFEDYWNNALVATNNGSNKPRIVWGPYPGNVLFYAIYRDEGGGSFSHIESVNKNTFNYTDNSVTISQQGQTIYYKVRAVGPGLYTNTVSTKVIPFKSISQEIFNNNIAFILEQNYPNPFNPATKINYTVAEDAKVQIKVYDMLGTEITELVNETKPAGNYEATFDGSNLSSGIYIYRITATNGERILFSRSKQMILMK
jgi:hypothetical protein